MKERVWCLLLFGPRECSRSLSPRGPRSNWESHVRITMQPSRVSYWLIVNFLLSLLLLYNRADGSVALWCWDVEALCVPDSDEPLRANPLRTGLVTPEGLKENSSIIGQETPVSLHLIALIRCMDGECIRWPPMPVRPIPFKLGSRCRFQPICSLWLRLAN
jgi:hypothetical protein